MILLLDVQAILPNRREDILGDPILEGFGLLLVAPHDELVEARLGDDRLVGVAAITLSQLEGFHLVSSEVGTEAGGSLGG